MQIKDLLNHGWVGSIIGLVGFAITLLSTIIGYVYGKRSLLAGRVYSQIHTTRILATHGYKLSELVTILFRGAPVERLAKSDIVIWNSGRTTIKGDSIVCSDPLRISFEDTCHVLQVRPLRTSRVVINFKADIAASRANEVLLSFDYLDHGDGVWLEIVHTSEKAPIVQGSIMGIPEGVCCRGSIAPHLAYARASRIRLLFLIITVAFLLLSVGSVIKSVSLTPFFWIFQVYIAMCIYIVGELLSRVARVVTLRELPSRLISPYPPPVRLPILEEESRLGLSSEQTERC